MPNTPSIVPVIPGIPQPLKRGGNIFIGTLNVASAPIRAIARPIRRHYDGRYRGQFRHAKKLFLFDALLVLGGLAVGAAAVYFIFLRVPPSLLTFRTEVSPSNVVAGGLIAIDIHYQNQKDTTLKNVTMRIDAPQLSDVSMRGIDTHPRGIFIGEVPGKAGGVVRVEGIVRATQGDELRIVVRSIGERADGKEDRGGTIVRIRVNEPPLRLEVAGPKTTSADERAIWHLSFRNQTGAPQKEVRIVPRVPKDLTGVTFTPQLKDGAWVFENLDGTRVIQSTFSGVVAARAGLLDFQFEEFIPVLQASPMGRERFSVQLVPQRVRIVAAIGGDPAFPLAPESDVPLSVTVTNRGEQIIRDVRARLTVPEGLVLTPLIKTASGFIEGTFMWDSTVAPHLKELAPGTSVTLQSTARLKRAFPTTFKDIQFTASPSATFTVGDVAEERTIVGAAVFKKVRTRFDAFAHARYFTEEGDQLGRGPVPPKVGAVTKYWVFYTLRTSTSNLTDVRSEGQLPNNVAWTGKVTTNTGNPPLFDPATRTVRYAAARIEAGGAGVSFGFEVALTPDTSQIGKPATLITDMHLEADDPWTGHHFSIEPESITTQLPFDSLTKGKGAVVQ